MENLLADEPLTLDPDLVAPTMSVGAQTDIFSFRLAGRSYGLPATSVELVAAAQTPTPVPTVPPHVLGVVHLRGRILTVIDLAVVLELEATPVDDRERRLVVIAAGVHPYAFLADATLGVRTVDAVALSAAADAIDGGGLVRTRIEDDQGVVSILDPVALVNRLLAAGAEGMS